MNSVDVAQWCEGYSSQPNDPLAYRGQPLIMGVLNITPDSFSDGGAFLHASDALRRADEMIAEGVDVIDIGGESSRPGAQSVSVDEELHRVIPVIAHIRKHHDIALSIDTCKPAVMRAAVEAGASLINDISALQMPGALSEASKLKVPVCLMHMQGAPETMQKAPSYSDDVVVTIDSFFSERIDACEAAGIPRQRLMLDPGFGFGKTVRHNLQLTKHLAQFQAHGRPVMLGVSRKSTLGAILNQPIEQRVYGGVGLGVFAALQGVCMIRTHDVGALKQALMMVHAVMSVDL